MFPETLQKDQVRWPIVLLYPLVMLLHTLKYKTWWTRYPVIKLKTQFVTDGQTDRQTNTDYYREPISTRALKFKIPQCFSAESINCSIENVTAYKIIIS